LIVHHVSDFFSSCPWIHSCLQLDLRIVHLQRHQSTSDHQNENTAKPLYCKKFKGPNYKTAIMNKWRKN
jgi:hypothetical protein